MPLPWHTLEDRWCVFKKKLRSVVGVYNVWVFNGQIYFCFTNHLDFTKNCTCSVLHVTLIQNLHTICQLNCNVQHCRNKKLYRYSIIFIKDMIRRSKDIQTRDLHTIYTSLFNRIFYFLYMHGQWRHEVGKTEKCAKLNYQHRNSWYYNWYYNRWCFNYICA